MIKSVFACFALGLLGLALSSSFQFRRDVRIFWDSQQVQMEMASTEDRLTLKVNSFVPSTVDVTFEKTASDWNRFLGFVFPSPFLVSHGTGFQWDERARLTFGDWSRDHFVSQPVSLSPQSWTGRELKLAARGRGSMMITLNRGQANEVIAHLRDGQITRDWSLSVQESATAQARSVGGWVSTRKWVSLGRSALHLLHWLSIGLIVLGFLRLLKMGAPSVEWKHSVFHPVQGLWFFAIIAFVGTAFWFQSTILENLPHVPDSVTSWVQSRFLTQFSVTAQAPGGMSDVFRVFPLQLAPNGSLFANYYMHFWPAVIAFCSLFGVGYWVNLILGILTGWGLFRFTEKTFGRFTAQIALILFGLSPWVLIQSGDYMNHMCSLCISVWGLSFLCWGGHRFRYGMLFAGLAVFQYAIRPVAAASNLMGWMAILFCFRRRFAVSLHWWKGAFVGFLGVGAALLLNQKQLTGSYFQSPYASTGHSLSFAHLPLGLKWSEVSLAQIDSILWPEPIGAFILGCSMAGIFLFFINREQYAVAERAAVLASAMSFLSLLVLYCFFHDHGMHGYGPRYYFDGLIFVIPMASATLARLVRRPSFAIVGVLAALLCFGMTLRELKTYHNYNGIQSDILPRVRSLDPEKAIVMIDRDHAPWHVAGSLAMLFDPKFRGLWVTRILTDSEKQTLKKISPFRRVYSWDGVSDHALIGSDL